MHLVCGLENTASLLSTQKYQLDTEALAWNVKLTRRSISYTKIQKQHYLAKFEMSEEVTTDAVAPPAEQASKLTNAQKARIERNLAKAQRLREAKLVLHPFKDLAR